MNKSKITSDEVVLLTPKFDGMSLLIKYEAGKFQKAYTRGNGQVGQDVTEHFQLFNSLYLAKVLDKFKKWRSEKIKQHNIKKDL